MLRFFLWILLIINGLLLALNFGLFGNWERVEREPTRLKAEKNADRLKVLAPNVAHDMIDIANKKAIPPIACLELGGINTADAKNVEEKLKLLVLGTRQTRTEMAEVATNMVYLPSLGSKDAADKKAAQLKKLGLTEFYIVQDQSPLRWGISLGVFKTPEAAQTHLANLVKKGLKEARIAPRAVSAAKVVYRLLDITPEEKKSLDALKESFSSAEMHECTIKIEAT
jgi:hypothetical protein